MNCTLCDAANADSANFCSQCGLPLPARECHACGAVFDKTENACPKCGEAVSSAAGSMPAATEPPVAAAPSAAVAASALALAGDAQLMDRLVRLLEQIEGELATRRLASASLDSASSPILISSSPALVARAVTPARRPKRAPWLIAGVLIIAASGVLLYGSYDRGLLDRFLQQASTLTSHFPSRASTVAADPVPAQLAPIPASATMPARVEFVLAPPTQPVVDNRAGSASAPTEPDEPASISAEQTRLDESAHAESTAAAIATAADSTVDHHPLRSEAEPEVLAPAVESASTRAAPEAQTPIGNEPDRQRVLARSESVPSPEEKAAASRIDQPSADDAYGAPASASRPTDDRGCRDNAISAMGLCETAR